MVCAQVLALFYGQLTYDELLFMTWFSIVQAILLR